MKRIGKGMPWIVGVIALFGLADCGIYGGGGGGGGKSYANIEGNIEAVAPADSGRSIVVFIYELGLTESEDCEEPDLPDDFIPYQSIILPAGETSFFLSGTGFGRLVVVFLLDGEDGEADGIINPGDPIAVLNDPDCVLDDVPANYVVNIADARLNFTLTHPDGFPASGRAEADVSERPIQ